MVGLASAMQEFVPKEDPESMWTDQLWVEVCRHGARAPKIIYPWTAPGVENF